MAEARARVEINGRLYDAISGEQLSVSHSKQSVVTTKRFIDGIVSPSRPLGGDAKPHVKAAPAKTVHVAAKKTGRLHPATHGAAPVAKSVFGRFRSPETEQQRAERAKSQARSDVIKRHHRGDEPYEIVSDSTVDKTMIDKMAPPSPVITSKLVRGLDIAKPTPPKPAEPEPTESPEISWLRRHLVPAVASFAALALMSGYLIYNSLPTLTMRVAASRAGFDAGVPNYQPSGFSFDGPVSYGPGRVVIRFNSKTDDSFYAITQATSNWDSRSLLENYVSQEAEHYVPFEEYGLTVYLYGDSKATWVDDGIWYTLEGNAKLNSEQLLKIASSL